MLPAHPIAVAFVILIASVLYLIWKLLVVPHSTRAARFHTRAVAFFDDRRA